MMYVAAEAEVAAEGWPLSGEQRVAVMSSGPSAAAVVVAPAHTVAVVAVLETAGTGESLSPCCGQRVTKAVCCSVSAVLNEAWFAHVVKQVGM